ncbi:SPOR domain-containing protein [Natronospirillum operosum]|uniref:SPOR domain-containing protein n=1 Tax=Natronospirillum operosum TaxID=2759953 RepID=A0A4Z0WIC6_9GAMM|nr:SPOR domain-containing protein [Natronospirillum operosum]TGG95391.1 SPOR domain-containing protein [Natronospirillum operosum]
MDSALKKRLIGALVLCVLLLLLLPVLFSGQGRLPEARITDIPQAPVLSEAPVLEPEQRARPEPEQVEEILAPSPPVEAEPEAEPPAAAEYETDDAGQIQAWSVQMGSFRDAANARRLLNSLREAGHEAYTRESLLSDGSTLTQVMVGPDRDYEAVQALKDELSDTFDVPALVVRFQP